MSLDDPKPSSDASWRQWPAPDPLRTLSWASPLRLQRRHGVYHVQLKRELIRSFDESENVRFVILLLIIGEGRAAVPQNFKYSSAAHKLRTKMQRKPPPNKKEISSSLPFILYTFYKLIGMPKIIKLRSEYY